MAHRRIAARVVAGAVPAELVGRESELRALVELLDAPDALPRTAVLAGDAGIGKTTVWLAALREAEARGYRALVARPSESEARFSFAALADLAGGVLAEVAPQLPGPQRRALETALAVRDAAGAPADERVVAFAFLAVLRALAAGGRVAVAVDDVQWLDAPSLAVLRYVLPRLEAEPVLALLTVRGDAPLWLRRDERLLALELGSLSVGALHELLRTRTGESLPRPALLRIWQTSGGNPFFALELARALRRRGGRVAPGEALPLPADLDALVHERLDGLGADALAVVRAVAALGDPTVDLVRAAVGRGADAGLGDALDARVLEPDGERLRLSHPLLASALVAAAPPAELRALHARLAAAVHDPEEQARHLALAASGPNEPVAAALEDAARRARARGAPVAAADLAEQALRLTPPADAAAVRRRSVTAADHVFASGDLGRARALLEGVLADLPAGPSRAAVRRRLAALATRTTGPRDGVAVYRKALREAAGDPALEAEIHLELAYTLRFSSTMRRAEPYARAAVGAAEQAGDGELLGRALAICGLVHFNLGRGVNEPLMERAVALQESLGLPMTGFSPKASLFEQLRWSDDLGAARALGEEVRAALHERDDPFEANLLALLALLEWRAGDWGRAAALADEARAMHEQSGWIGLSPLQAWPRTVIAAHRGDPDEARELAGEALAGAEAAGIATSTGSFRWVLGAIELGRGDRGAALPHLRRARELREGLDLLEPNNRLELPDLLDALAGVGEVDEAEAVLAPWEERARGLDRAWALAAAARTRGVLLAARGDSAAALAAFERALAEHDRAQDPFQRARTLLALGTAQRRAKLRGAARRTLGEALAAFEALPAPLWAAQARAELARIGGRSASGDELTPTERRVAGLVAEGKPTKEVAQALFVSPKTVEKHLSRIYAKLGVRSRAELAHRLAGKE
jgi:DNA-binding CsgD family transcriptional regulator